MKKISILSLVVLLTTLWIYTGCRKESKAPTKITAGAALTAGDQTLIQQYACVGTMHNDGLDYIYGQLLAYKQSQIATYGKFQSTKSDLFNLYNQYTADYVTSAWSLSASENSYELSDIKSFNHDFFINNVDYSTDYIQQHLSVTYSAAMTRAVDILFAIGDSTTLTDSTKYAAWDTLLTTYIDSVANDTEKIGLISSINTAIASYRYWHVQSNVDKWNDLLADLVHARTTATDADHWRADAEGALGGGIRGALSGVELGPGGMLAGGICGAVAGACSGTAGSCIKALIWSWLS